jgi:hypothetical protein
MIIRFFSVFRTLKLKNIICAIKIPSVARRRHHYRCLDASKEVWRARELKFSGQLPFLPLSFRHPSSVISPISLAQWYIYVQLLQNQFLIESERKFSGLQNAKIRSLIWTLISELQTKNQIKVDFMHIFSAKSQTVSTIFYTLNIFVLKILCAQSVAEFFVITTNILYGFRNIFLRLVEIFVWFHETR